MTTHFIPDASDHMVECLDLNKLVGTSNAENTVTEA